MSGPHSTPAREAAVRAFFWGGAFFAGWIHFIDRVHWASDRPTKWWHLLVISAVFGGLAAWSTYRTSRRHDKPPRGPEALLWIVVTGGALAYALTGEPIWWSVAVPYALATVVIAVVDARRTRMTRASREQVLHR